MLSVKLHWEPAKHVDELSFTPPIPQPPSRPITSRPYCHHNSFLCAVPCRLVVNIRQDMPNGIGTAQLSLALFDPRILGPGTVRSNYVSEEPIRCRTRWCYYLLFPFSYTPQRAKASFFSASAIFRSWMALSLSARMAMFSLFITKALLCSLIGCGGPILHYRHKSNLA